MAIHDGGRGWDAEPVRQSQAEPVEQGGLRFVRADDAAKADVAAERLSGREHDVDALKPAKLLEDAPGRVAQAGLALPVLESLPEHVSEEANEDMRLDPFLLLVPDGAN